MSREVLVGTIPNNHEDHSGVALQPLNRSGTKYLEAFLGLLGNGQNTSRFVDRFDFVLPRGGT